MFQEYDQKYSPKQLFLEKLHLCRKLVNSPTLKSCSSQSCQLSHVQRRVKKTLLKVPFTSPAGQVLIKYSKLITKKNCTSTYKRTLRSDAENTRIITEKTTINETKLLENRSYTFSRHPLSINIGQANYLAFNGARLNKWKLVSVKIKRLTQENITTMHRRRKETKLLTNRNENQSSKDNSQRDHFTFKCKAITVKLKRLTNKKIAAIQRRQTDRDNDQRMASVLVKRLNSDDIEALNRTVMKNYAKNVDLLKQCSPLKINIKRLKSDDDEVIQQRSNECKRLTIKLKGIVSKQYRPNSWLKAYYR